MGIIKNTLDRYGFNLKERVYVYSGMVIGAIAPIVGCRLMLGYFHSPENWKQELLASGLSLLASIPIVPYTFIFGGISGELVALESRQKRAKRESNLVNITSN